MYLPEVPVYPGRMSWRYRSNVRTNFPLEEVAHERPQHGEFLSTQEAKVIFTNGINESYSTGVEGATKCMATTLEVYNMNSFITPLQAEKGAVQHELSINTKTHKYLVGSQIETPQLP